MSTAAAPFAERLSLRTAQLLRALFAAVAAVMITFSSDHSAPVGLAVFSGFAIATGLIFVLAAWLTYPKGRRVGSGLLAAAAIVAGMVAGIPGIREPLTFFLVVIAWAFVSGIIELVCGLRDRRRKDVASAEARDSIILGSLGLLLGVALLFVPADYALDYFVEAAGQNTLTGITIAVGIFGGYAAIVAVFLAIAAFSPVPAAKKATHDASAPDGSHESLASPTTSSEERS